MKTNYRRNRRPRPRPSSRVDPWSHLTFGAISRGTGLDTSTVSRIFRGERRPTIPSARKLAGFLGVSLDRLLGELKVS